MRADLINKLRAGHVTILDLVTLALIQAYPCDLVDSGIGPCKKWQGLSKGVCRKSDVTGVSACCSLKKPRLVRLWW